MIIGKLNLFLLQRQVLHVVSQSGYPHIKVTFSNGSHSHFSMVDSITFLVDLIVESSYYNQLTGYYLFKISQINRYGPFFKFEKMAAQNVCFTGRLVLSDFPDLRLVFSQPLD